MISLLRIKVLCFAFLYNGKPIQGQQCRLCRDESSMMAHPGLVLDLKRPLPLKTCQDLGNALTFLSEDSDLCSNARSLATLCGCPQDSNFDKCTICDKSTSMTRPKQVLDGLVDLGDQDTFGLERTCELVESSINILSKDEYDYDQWFEDGKLNMSYLARLIKFLPIHWVRLLVAIL